MATSSRSDRERRAPLHVAYVCADPGVALDAATGSGVHVRELIRALAARGVRVSVFSAAPVPAAAARALGAALVPIPADPELQGVQRRLLKSLHAEGRPTTRAGEIAQLLRNQALIDALRRRRPRIDLVYERAALFAVAGLQYARAAGVPYCVELNAPLVEQQQTYRDLDLAETARAIEDQVLCGADRLLVTSAALRDYAQARGVSRRAVRILPCGVARERLVALPRPARAGERFTIGFLGTLKPWHGVELLLEAFARLRALSPVYHLLVVGDGPLAGAVRDAGATPALAGAITLTGTVPATRVPALLAQMDVGAAPYPELPSFYFSPLKVWEYAAAGVPIVASASGELPRLFPHKLAALLHEPGRVGKIVKHVERLRADPVLAARLARRARAVARQHTWDRLAARLLTIAAGIRPPRA